MVHDEIFEVLRTGDAAALRRILADRPAAARARDGQGQSALMAALYAHRPDLAALLRELAEPLDVFEAAALGDAARVRALAAADAAAPRARAADGFTALHLACYFGHGDVASALLEQGADPAAPAENPARLHPLHAAAAARRADLVAALLERGARPDAAQHGGWTALHAAARHGDLDVARALLAAGASRDVRADSGERPRDLLPADAPAELRALLEADA